MTDDQRHIPPIPELATFAILPTEEEKARANDPDADPALMHAGLYHTTMFDELAIVEHAIKLLDDPEYERAHARALVESLREDDPTIPEDTEIPPIEISDEERARRRKKLVEDRERILVRRAKRLPAVGVQAPGLPATGDPGDGCGGA